MNETRYLCVYTKDYRMYTVYDTSINFHSTCLKVALFLLASFRVAGLAVVIRLYDQLYE